MCKLRTESSHCSRLRLGGMLAVALLGVMVTSAEGTKSSSAAKELFVRSCAVCHSADGKVQTRVAKERGGDNRQTLKQNS
jgi:hypothetical protein